MSTVRSSIVFKGAATFWSCQIALSEISEVRPGLASAAIARSSCKCPHQESAIVAGFADLRERAASALTS
jgi:hypothetical protein